MSRHFHDELRDLKQELLKMSSLAEESIYLATKSLLEREKTFAKQVFEKEKLINQMEIAIDDKGHSLLALDQPMAADMRMITAVLKINIDLERLGDHAVNIAERSLSLIDEPPLETNLQLNEMTLAVRRMLREAIESFISGNVVLARQVLKRDDEVDGYNDSLYLKLQSLMERDPLIVKTGLKLVRVGHDLERIADLANNIAEDVVYMEQGKEVRHRFESQ